MLEKKEKVNKREDFGVRGSLLPFSVSRRQKGEQDP